MFDFLTNTFSSIFKTMTGQSKLTEANIAHAIEQVKDALLQADVPYQVVLDFIAHVQADVIGKKVLQSLKPSEQFTTIVHDRMLQLLSIAPTHDLLKIKTPAIILMMGLQGSGKTTTIGKLAYYLKNAHSLSNKNFKIMTASLDFYRPAAIDQLEIVSKQAGVDFYRAKSNVVQEATVEILNYYKQHGFNYLLLDSAGRLQIDEGMMQELALIKKTVNPSLSFLVLDAMTGQQSLSIAQQYEQKVGIDSVVLSKMDSQARAGVAFAVASVVKKPIDFVGIGEKHEHLEKFYPDRVVKRILGMGDLDSLLEKATQTIKKEEQEKVAQRFLAGDLTLDDFAKQLEMMNKMGSLSSLVKYLPGMGQFAISKEQAATMDKDLKKILVMIGSMTRKERQFPKLLADISRKKRIAQGAGVHIADINQMLQKFEETRQFAKLLKNNRFFSK